MCGVGRKLRGVVYTLLDVRLHSDPISSGRVCVVKTQAQWESLHTRIMLVIPKYHLVQLGRIDGPSEYLLHTRRDSMAGAGEQHERLWRYFAHQTPLPAP